MAIKAAIIMKTSKSLAPDYIFELSWEICNKVGGIHTVLSSLATTMSNHFGKNVVYVGPDLNTSEFTEDKGLHGEWMQALKAAGLRARIGRWNIPSEPTAIVVDVNQCVNIKNAVYADMWDAYRVDSLHAYDDYDESSMWAYASGRVIETIVSKCLKKSEHVVLQAHEWLSAMGLLHIKSTNASVATVFTTHATSIGRSICGNGKSLYKYLDQYDGDIMARELNMQSKHSSEKAAALYSDCFTTVSMTTDRECRALLCKQCDVILPNGFDTSIVPDSKTYKAQRTKARRKILNVVNSLTGRTLADSTLIISTSGRNDYRPKGFDVYLEAMRRLNGVGTLPCEVVALVEVPCWVKNPREDLLARLVNDVNEPNTPLCNPFITHELHNMDYDRIVGTIRSLGLDNCTLQGKVHVLLVPTYIDGNDGIFNMKYYELLTGCDFTVYPSYYEPWGYTPMESAAFRIPTITTDLSGFGCWARETSEHYPTTRGGVTVLHRDDDNYFELAENVKNEIVNYCMLDAKGRQHRQQAAAETIKHALWKYFIENYIKAFAFALERVEKRNAGTQTEKA